MENSPVFVSDDTNQTNDYISPERLANLQKLSRNAQNGEINMQRDIATAQNLSWFDRCIKLLAQFCLGLACALALALGVRLCSYCLENNDKNCKSPPVILVDNGRNLKDAKSDLDLSYRTLHKPMKEANDLMTTIDIDEKDNNL